MGGVYSKFGVGVPFDPDHSLVTSPVYTPLLLAFFRLLFGFYYLVCLIVKFSWDSVNSPVDNERFFSYFTHLSEIGLCAYFWAAGVQTFAYARWDKYPLRHWPRFLQLLHLWLCSTAITFPFVVTIAFWALLSSSKTFSTPFSAWDNVSVHILNSVFALFEILSTFIGPLPWLYLPLCLFIIALYIGLAYLTHASQHFYPYDFLDPSLHGAQVAAYVFGVLIGECIIFSVAWGLSKLRNKIFAQRRRAAVPHDSSSEKGRTNYV